MKSLAFFSISTLLLVAPACATALQDDSDGLGDRGTDTGGGTSTGGGLLVTSGGTSSGGSASTGGASTGGAATGGTGTGGTTYEGDCADKPTFAEWGSTTGATGDEVVFTCTTAQAGCAGKTVGVAYL